MNSTTPIPTTTSSELIVTLGHIAVWRLILFGLIVVGGLFVAYYLRRLYQKLYALITDPMMASTTTVIRRIVDCAFVFHYNYHLGTTVTRPNMPDVLSIESRKQIEEKGKRLWKMKERIYAAYENAADIHEQNHRTRSRVRTNFMIITYLLLVISAFLTFLWLGCMVIQVSVLYFINGIGLISLGFSIACYTVVSRFVNGLYVWLSEGITIGEYIEYGGGSGFVVDLGYSCIELFRVDVSEDGSYQMFSPIIPANTFSDAIIVPRYDLSLNTLVKKLDDMVKSYDTFTVFGTHVLLDKMLIDKYGQMGSAAQASYHYRQFSEPRERVSKRVGARRLVKKRKKKKKTNGGGSDEGGLSEEELVEIFPQSESSTDEETIDLEEYAE